MKKMEYTTKINCNPLSLRDLGGGIGVAVTSSLSYNYAHRAFRRCQSMASAEGSDCFIPPQWRQDVCLPEQCCSVDNTAVWW